MRTHLKACRLGAVDITLDIDIEASFKGFLSDHEKVGIIYDTCIVDKDIYGLKALLDISEHSLDMSYVRCVSLEDLTADTCGNDLFLRAFRCLVIICVIKRNIIAFICEL